MATVTNFFQNLLTMLSKQLKLFLILTHSFRRQLALSFFSYELLNLNFGLMNKNGVLDKVWKKQILPYGINGDFFIIQLLSVLIEAYRNDFLYL